MGACRARTSRSELDASLELLVLGGEFSDGVERADRLSWLRLPPGAHLKARTGPGGARVWIKAGALLQENICEF